MFLDVPVMMGGMSRQGNRRRVASYVVSRRGALGLSQDDLATKAGVDAKTIYNLESGERWPWATTRSKIEAALGIAEGDLERIADGYDPTLRDEHDGGAGGDFLDENLRARIAELPEHQRSVVEELLQELIAERRRTHEEQVAAHRRNQQMMEKMVFLISGGEQQKDAPENGQEGRSTASGGS